MVRKKTNDNIIDLIEYPLYILLGWSVLSFVVINILMLYADIMSYLGWAIMVIGFGIVGYNAYKNKQDLGTAVKAGLLCGSIVGFLGALLSIVSVYFFPAYYTSMLSSISGVSYQEALEMMKLYVFAGLITNPIILGIIGLLISLITFLIFDKIIKS